MMIPLVFLIVCVSAQSGDDDEFVNLDVFSTNHYQRPFDNTPGFPEMHHPVLYAALPQQLAVFPLPLENSDHELKLNVSWQPGLGPPARDYSLEVRSVTDTVDCQTPMCYEYNIPGDTSMWTIPMYSNPVAETCAVRPGCAYRVRLIAHPWDGHTTANMLVELDECVAGVCSCGHAPRLPAPMVFATTVVVQDELFANITWSLPQPTSPQRLPPGLQIHNYAVSIGKQMVSNAHPAPWFANTITRLVEADGLVSEGDEAHSLLLPIEERGGERGRQWSGERGDKRRLGFIYDVKLLARVNLIDERGCFGPAGNATIYDPAEISKVPLGTYILWAVFGGACVIAMGAIIAVSARGVKRILNAFRPSSSTGPLDPLRRRPAWFPLQLRTFYEKFRIPGVIGCIDGTFVAMVRPRDNEERYFCRKGFHARNVMLINDADLNIVHVDASYGGATHDSFVFNHSVIRDHLENLTNSGEVVYLLGDAGYPQRSYLMTPVAGATGDTPEGYYNKLHATGRNSVERTIGILKGRFRCLLAHRVLHYHPDTVAKIVVACCVLHNICNRAGLPSPIHGDDTVLNERLLFAQADTQNLELEIGRRSRMNLINSLWLSRT